MVEKNTVFIDDLPMYKVLNTKVVAKIVVWTDYLMIRTITIRYLLKSQLANKLTFYLINKTKLTADTQAFFY